jgi:hypothetical protein
LQFSFLPFFFELPLPSLLADALLFLFALGSFGIFFAYAAFFSHAVYGCARFVVFFLELLVNCLRIFLFWWIFVLEKNGAGRLAGENRSYYNLLLMMNEIGVNIIPFFPRLQLISPLPPASSFSRPLRHVLENPLKTGQNRRKPPEKRPRQLESSRRCLGV